jgi:hypothetical protein
MAVLKDIQCVKCGAVREALIDSSLTSIEAECGRCKKPRFHRPLCNGGCRGARWRFNDWSGFDPEGYVEHIGVKAGRPHPEAVGTADESRSATVDVLRSTGKPAHEQARFGSEAIADRRERRKFKQRQREGRTPLRFHG